MTSSEHQNPLYLNLELELGPGSEAIRLLELLPGTGDGPVEARLFCVQKPQDRPYEALSYTWGAKVKSRTIQVNGQLVHVNDNLFNALVSLRLEDRSRTLWVDALCINQKDNAEKQAQVAMMGTIYHETDTVLIFLGMPTAQS
ncbi:heterokaryon incompatibility protein-domain-containing protein, partial [Immersiella caudata]